jgi:hypothetical protein
MSRRDRIKVNAPQVVGEVIDGEAVIVNLKSGAYYSLAGPGGVVWSCIERRASQEEIASTVKARYLGDGGEIEADIVRLLGELEVEGLVVPADSAAETARPAEAAAASVSAPPYESMLLKRYDDMQDLLLLDPIHEVDEMGWPNVKPAPDPAK